MNVTTLAQVLINWLVLGALYVLIAVGLSLVFSIMRLINFAHAQFYVLGAFALYYFYIQFGMPYPVAVLVSGAAVAVVAFIVERIFIRPLQSDQFAAMIGTLGLLLIMNGAALVVFGSSPDYVPLPIAGIIRIGGVYLPIQKLLLGVTALAVVGILWAFLRWNRAGRAMRAISQDLEGARLQGIDVARVNALGFTLGSALAGLAGALLMPLTAAVTVGVGDPIMAKMFIVVILGGLGSLSGAVAGAFVLAFIETVLFTYVGSVAIFLSFLLVLLVFLVRPRGLASNG